MAARKETLEVGGREVTISNPDKVYFPQTGHTKLDVVRYYLATADATLVGVRGRPMALKRYVNGVEGEAFYQKRAPENRPEWIDTVELKYPSGRSAHELVVREAATLAWLVNLGCVDLHPHPTRAEDLAHPDELRVDLDPIPGVSWADVRTVALVVREVLTDFGLVGWPKTTGSRGMHIYCRIEPKWTFTELRRAGLALAREVETRVPDLATSKWWKEERHGVFVDYNQNAKDRTTASAYSIRPLPDARVSTPLDWDEVPDCDAEAFTIDTVPARLAQRPDPSAGIDDAVGSLTALLELAERHREEGLPDAPSPNAAQIAPSGAPARKPARKAADKAANKAGTSAKAAAAEPSDEAATKDQGTVAPPAPGKTSGASGRRRSTMPLIEIARAANKDEAMQGLERWKARHPAVWEYLEPADVLVDSMRGRSSAWSRIRLNLRHVPEAERPPQEPLEVDFDPWKGWTPGSPRPDGGRSTPKAGAGTDATVDIGPDATVTVTVADEDGEEDEDG